jgi:hypothetical protein
MPALDSLTRAAEISLDVARRAGSLVLSTVRQVAGMAFDHRSQSEDAWAPPPPASAGPAPVSTRPRHPSPPAPEPVPTPASAAAPARAQAASAPDHVDREAVVVAQSADAGAEDGAGPQIRVGEPWKGYGRLTAKEVNDRLATASPEALAVARLYESTNRNRVTVLKQIDRRLAAAQR